MSKEITRTRIESIDILRGFAMIFMALDHTRDFFSNSLFDPTDLLHTSPSLFFTRWITYLSAPIFMLLIGTGMSLAISAGKSKKEIAFFLFTRGIWMFIAEMTLIHFVWSFSLTGNFEFGVFAVIGVAMMSLAVLIFLPNALLFIFAFALIAGHNLLDGNEASWLGTLSWLHVIGDYQLPFIPMKISVGYPIIPWIAVPVMGYLVGNLYRLNQKTRQLWFHMLGATCILLFVLLRYSHIYGDPNDWSMQNNFLFTIMSFLNCTKYPPSLLYLLMTLGPAFLLLAWFENINNFFTKIIATYGKVPFFFYVCHIALLHIFAVINAVWRTGDANALFGGQIIGGQTAIANGYNLGLNYILWLLVLIILFPLCKKYAEYKRNNRDKVWLSYL